MGIKVTDVLAPSQYGTMDARELLDYLGDYAKAQIAEVHTLIGGVYTCDVPNQLQQYADAFALTLPQQTDTDYTSGNITITITSYPRQEMQDALSDSTTNISKLISAWSTAFDITQATCLTQFNTPSTPPPPPLKGPDGFPFVYIPSTFFTPIAASIAPGTPEIGNGN